MNGRWIAALLGFCSLLPLVGCGSGYDISTEEGRIATVDAVNFALSENDCKRAIELIDPIYNSENTNNEVRILRGAAYGCAAGVNFFKAALALAGSGLSGTAIWTTTAQQFTSEYGDDRMEASWLALESLMTVLKPARILPPEYQVNAGSRNVGTLYADYRTDNSNAFLVFAAMAMLGTTQNRYGKPAGVQFPVTGYKWEELPWTTSTDFVNNSVACGFAGGIFHVLDGISTISSATTGAVRDALSTVTSIRTALNYACIAGCMAAPAIINPLGYDFNTGCTMSATEAQTYCSPCPMEMKNRYGCNDARYSDEKNPIACSAAGIVRMINKDQTYGWPGP